MYGEQRGRHLSKSKEYGRGVPEVHDAYELYHKRMVNIGVKRCVRARSLLCYA
jgi:hypothetical protein